MFASTLVKRPERTIAGSLLIALLAAGCQTPPKPAPEMSAAQSPHERAMECLKRGIAYPYNTAVRVASIEALREAGSREGIPWIRSALLDEEPAARFAACVALGELKDELARESIERLVDDADPNVQIAAIFALHRLGDTRYSHKLPGFLLSQPDPAVRRNAALLLGRLEQDSAIKILARAMRDPDPGVRDHALEAMARLGNEDARQQLAFMTNSGVGSDEVFAINALADTLNPVNLDLFLYKLSTALHIETQLAAARALGLLRDDTGYQLALNALHFDKPRHDDPDDNPADQILRARQLAAAALGAIGKKEAIPRLMPIMETNPDPRLQVSAARAILEILGERPEVKSFPYTRPAGGS